MLTLLDITSEGMIETAELIAIGQLTSWYTDTEDTQIHFIIEALYRNKQNGYFVKKYYPSRHD